jgi:hypothetical protein
MICMLRHGWTADDADESCHGDWNYTVAPSHAQP